MRCKAERILLGGRPLDLDSTLGCGQAFRWKKEGEWWHGVAGGRVFRLKSEGEGLLWEAFPALEDPRFLEDYLGLHDDLSSIQKGIGKDPVIRRAIRLKPGLRILRQEPWECAVTFLCATYSNLTSITRMVRNLCSRWGTLMRWEGREFHAFPDPATLSQASLKDLRACRVGYRARHILETARRVGSGGVDLEALRRADYASAKTRLLAKVDGTKLLLGMGPKVADCVLLFSLGKTEAFPVDTRIFGAILEHYPRLFDKRLFKRLRHAGRQDGSLSSGLYEEISEVMRDYFGRYAGYAQQYLYCL